MISGRRLTGPGSGFSQPAPRGFPRRSPTVDAQAIVPVRQQEPVDDHDRPPAGRHRGACASAAAGLVRTVAPGPPRAGRPGRARRPPQPVGADAATAWRTRTTAAAVRSMSTSWHDFLYGSFDAGGVMTVDKPPLALWVQALSVRVFGFHSREHPGAAGADGRGDRRAGLRPHAPPLGPDRRLGGRAGAGARRRSPWRSRATTTRTPCWCCAAPPRSGSRCGHWRTGAPAGWSGRASSSGLGFETKMGAALLIVPGLVAAWMWVAPRGRVAALRSMRAAGGGDGRGGRRLAAADGAHARGRPAVDLGHQRQQHLVADLGYNGLGRLDGQAGAPTGAGRRRRRLLRRRAPVRCACSTRASAARPAGCSAWRWSAASASPSRAGCGAPTRAPAG